VKYLLLKAIAKKVHELGNSGRLFLPYKWFMYSQITCCDREALKYSKPNNLFTLRPCLILRVEHIPLDDRDKLFLLADFKIKRFNVLNLSNIVRILLEKGLNIFDINELLRKHYYNYVDGDKRIYCMVKKVKNNEAEIVIEDEVKTIPMDKIVMNPQPKHTRDFIENQMGEKIREIEKIQRTFSIQRPKHKIESIKAVIKRLIIENKIFPLKLSDVEYNLELTPQKIIPLGEE